MVLGLQTSKIFVGVCYAGDEQGLVALFEVIPGQERYYMTISELCDRIEHQMGTGMYYHARTALMVDRAALLALIEAQRKVLALKASHDDFPVIESGATAFAKTQIGWKTVAQDNAELDK